MDKILSGEQAMRVLAYDQKTIVDLSLRLAECKAENEQLTLENDMLKACAKIGIAENEELRDVLFGLRESGLIHDVIIHRHREVGGIYGQNAIEAVDALLKGKE